MDSLPLAADKMAEIPESVFHRKCGGPDCLGGFLWARVASQFPHFPFGTTLDTAIGLLRLSLARPLSLEAPRGFPPSLCHPLHRALPGRLHAVPLLACGKHRPKRFLSHHPAHFAHRKPLLFAGIPVCAVDMGDMPKALEALEALRGGELFPRREQAQESHGRDGSPRRGAGAVMKEGNPIRTIRTIPRRK